MEKDESKKRPAKIVVDSSASGDASQAKGNMPLSPIMGVPVDLLADPGTPNRREFVSRHAVFQTPTPMVLKTWARISGKDTATHQRSLSSIDVNEKVVQFGSIINDLIRAKKSVKDRDADLQLAAGVGEALLDKVAGVEQVCVELQQTVQERDEQILYLESQLDTYKQHIEELRNANLALVQMDTDEKDDTDDDLESFTVQEFLKSELSKGYVDDDGKVLEFTGDTAKDLVTFRRKLRRERKQAELANGLYEEARSTFADEKDEIQRQLRLLKNSSDATAQLKAEKEKVERKLEESMEQLKNLNIQHMALMRRKKAAEEEANANKAKAQEQVKREQSAKDAQIKQLKEQVRTLQHESTRLTHARSVGGAEEVKEVYALNDELQTKVKVLQEASGQKDETIAQLNKKLSAFREMAMSLQNQTDEEKARVERAEREAEELRQQQQELENRINALQSELVDAEEQNLAAPRTDSSDAEYKKKMEDLMQEKAHLEVKLMINRSRDKNRLEELRRKEEELKKTRMKAAQLGRERADLEHKFNQAEEIEKAKFAKHHETISKITNQLRVLMKEYSKKKQESHALQKELENLKKALAGIDSLKNAKSKYKEMGRKMLAAMKQMDVEMKQMVTKLEAAQKENRLLQKEKRKLIRKNDDLTRELETTEKQMNKLMRICITGTVNT